jgi:hypothetical protein
MWAAIPARKEPETEQIGRKTDLRFHDGTRGLIAVPR